MRFHLLGLAHLPTHKKFSQCAYTNKIVRLSKMLRAKGHTVIFYGVEGSEVECDEFVQVLSEKERVACYGEYDMKKEFFKLDGGDAAYTTFNLNTIEEINKRKVERDVLLCSMGCWHQPVAKGTGVLAVESGIGYEGVFSHFKVFESYAWMHWIYGKRNIVNGVWFDSVIPNYFDLESFPFQEKKGDYALFVGRLVHRKGIDVAVEVTRRLGMELIVAGQGSLVNPREKLNITSSHVKHVGCVGPEERAQLMGGARVCFAPTYYIEPFGGVAVEAQLCVLPKTNLGLSNKYFEDAKIGDSIESEVGVVKVVDTMKRDYCGDVFTIKGLSMLPFTVTRGHQVKTAKVERTYNPEFRKQGKMCYVRSVKDVAWKNVEDVSDEDYLVIPKSSIEIKKEGFVLESKTYTQKEKKYKDVFLPINEDTMRLFGYYVAEGGSAENAAKIYFGSHEPDLVSDVIDIIERYTPYKVTVKELGSVFHISFGGNVIARFLRENFGKISTEKMIPDWILYAPLDLLESFLRAYIDGDGCYTGRALSISTSSKLLAMQLQKAFLRFGVLVSITIDNREGEVNICGRTCHQNVRYLIRSKTNNLFNNIEKGNRLCSRFLEDDKAFYVPVSSIIKDSYSGEVYNVTTEDSTYCLGNVLVHNCGTPVLTSDFGAFTETIQHGKTGFRCRTIEEFVWAAKNADKLKPEDCREWAAANYSMERVSDMYEEYFHRIASLWGEGWYAENEARIDLNWLRKHYIND